MVRLGKRVLLLLLLIVLSQVGSASTPSVVVVLWHDLQWSHIQMGTIWDQTGVSLGIMNTRIGGGSILQGSYLTIGSGSRAFGLSNAEQVYHGDELVRQLKAQQIYQVRTDMTISNTQIVQLEIAMLLEAAKQAQYQLQIGSLGQDLAAANLAIGAFGNSDTGEDLARWAGLVAIDQQGVVPYGTIRAELLVEDLTYPFGRRTDYPLLLTEVLASPVDLAIIDLGDPYRYSTYKKYLVPSQQTRLEEQMVRAGWQFVDQLVQALPEVVVIIISPYPGEERARKGQWFSPIIVIDKAEGLLSSATTRWPGLVTNLDVAPLILSTLAVDSSSMIGRPMFTSPGLTGLELLDFLQSMEEKVFALSRYRSQVLRFLVGFQIMLYLITLIVLVLPATLERKYIQVIQILLSVSLLLPLVLLLLAQSWFWAMVPVVTLLITYHRLKLHQLELIASIALITAGLILFDVVRGSWWIRFSFLGYDPIGGARYYGIGNEFMGILIGATIIGWTIMRMRLIRQGSLLDLGLFAFVAFVIAAPQLGTNVGGAITAVVGFGVTWMGLRRIPYSMRTLLVLVLVIGITLTGLMLFDGMRPRETQSHIGQTVSLIQADGLEAVTQIITRKASMNLRLFRYSFWSRGLIAAIVAMGASLIWPSHYRHWLIKTHPVLVKGLMGVLAATITALLVNDSGVVAAATCSFYAATTMLTLALSLKHNFTTS